MRSILVIDAGNTSVSIALFMCDGATVTAKTSIRGGIAAARGACPLSDARSTALP